MGRVHLERSRGDHLVDPAAVRVALHDTRDIPNGVLRVLRVVLREVFMARMKWDYGLNNDETWLLSDREILGRAQKSAGTQGILLTLPLPNGEQYQAEVDKLNASSGSTYCDMVREYYNEWKASKAAASKRKHADLKQQRILDGSGEVAGGEPDVGLLSVPETVQALEAGVQETASFEESIFQQVAAAQDRVNQLTHDLRDATRQLKALEAAKEVFSASKILEAAGRSVHQVRSEEEGTLDSEAPSSSADEGTDT